MTLILYICIYSYACLHIWVSLCRAGKMAVLCHSFLKVEPDEVAPFFNCKLFIICFRCPKHFGWICWAILEYPDFDRFYPQSAVSGIFWGRITAFLVLNVYNWTWHNVPIILGIVFRWFSFFWFLSSSSRTRARPVWSLRDKRATNHHHRQWLQLQNSKTSNSSSSGSRQAREELKKRKIIYIQFPRWWAH